MFKYIFFFFCFFSYSFNDAPRSWQIYFQDPASPIMEGIINFHNHLMFFIILVFLLVCWVLFKAITLFKNNLSVAKFAHATVLEIVWTIFPAIILVLIAIPSFSLLYAIDQKHDPYVSIKAVGRQWYWHYEYGDYKNSEDVLFEYDSYMLPFEDLPFGTYRLLEVDNRVVLPTFQHIRIGVSASDVIHSWAVPSFGIKMDGIPGRVNEIFVFINREGTFYGQCSEICGVNHGFMPIVVKSLPTDEFVQWVNDQVDQL